MNFPQNAAELEAAMRQRQEKAVELGKQSDALRQESEQLHNVSDILGILLTSWDDPSNYRMTHGGHAYFFVKPGVGRVFAREFLPDNAKPHFNYPVVLFAETGKYECEQCHQNDCPVVEHEHRHPGWTAKGRILLCLNCNTAGGLASQKPSA